MWRGFEKSKGGECDRSNAAELVELTNRDLLSRNGVGTAENGPRNDPSSPLPTVGEVCHERLIPLFGRGHAGRPEDGAVFAGQGPQLVAPRALPCAAARPLFERMGGAGPTRSFS